MNKKMDNLEEQRIENIEQDSGDCGDSGDNNIEIERRRVEETIALTMLYKTAMTDIPDKLNHSRYLIISHISKKNNVMQLINVALAYAFVPVLVGAKAIKSQLPPSLQDYYLYFEYWNELVAWLAEERLPLYGIEIAPEAQSILEFPFPHRIALMPGNEGTGLNEKQRKASTGCLYIPHYGEGTASLNVHIATTIVMHHYAEYTNHLAP